ncbi:hypothetical protein SAMN05444747_110110 [Variovorax sp. OV329]|nr:hypothetical protein SAMN05444747_110110 [Variovorax sp. OV329]
MNERVGAAVLLWALVALGAGPAWAGHGDRDWFTVSGDPTLANGDTVQVDPVATRTEGDMRTMRVRVSRSQERRNWDDVPYRSYEARVAINCRSRRAHYLDAVFYLQPQWEGPAHLSANYQKNPQPMLFKGMNPNPTERIIRAACRPPG